MNEGYSMLEYRKCCGWKSKSRDIRQSAGGVVGLLSGLIMQVM